MNERRRSFGRSRQKSAWVAPQEPLSLSNNERMIMLLVRRHKTISRAELARLTGLALPSVGRLTARLIQLGLLSAGQKVASGPGQPSLPLSLSTDAVFSAGLSVTADGLSLAVIGLQGQQVIAKSEPIDATDKPRLFDRAATILDELHASGKVNRERLFGLGVAFSGFFTGGHAELATPVGMDGWALTDLERAFEDRLGLPVWIENDGSAAAAGEALYGIGTSVKSFAYIYIDRGLCGGVVVDGKLWRGANGNAGEFTGILPPHLRAERPNLLMLWEIANAAGAKFKSVPEMIEKIDLRSEAVDRWLEKVSPQMDAIVSAIAATFDPQTIVVGGRLPVGLVNRLIEKTHYYSVPVRGVDRAYPSISPSSLQGDAVALGAASLPFSAHLF